jgi:hypothetical protein
LTTTIRIDARFSGPPNSANGGYTCGLIAAAIGETVNVRLYLPPPLNTDLELSPADQPDKWLLKQGDKLIAAATTTQVRAHVPNAPTYVEALEASKHFTGHSQHAYANCFVCGPQRTHGDGLRIFAGKLSGSNVVAAPWLPRADLGNEQGKIKPEFIWSALDCPGYFASVKPGRSALLGELAVHIDRSIHVEEPCVIIGWQIIIEGRKHKVGTALFDEDGERCAVGVATWIELA